MVNTVVRRSCMEEQCTRLAMAREVLKTTMIVAAGQHSNFLWLSRALVCVCVCESFEVCNLPSTLATRALQARGAAKVSLAHSHRVTLGKDSSQVYQTQVTTRIQNPVSVRPDFYASFSLFQDGRLAASTLMQALFLLNRPSSSCRRLRSGRAMGPPSRVLHTKDLLEICRSPPSACLPGPANSAEQRPTAG